MVTFEQVWQEQFEPIVADIEARRSARQSEAFLDSTLTVCGEELRQMTPEDLLYLDGFQCPFVCGGQADAFDRAFFIWQLHAKNSRNDSLMNRYRQGRVLRRLHGRDLAADIAEIDAYCHRMLADIPDEKDEPEAESPALKRRPGVYFLAPLLVSVAKEIGPHDPMSGELLAHTPLPRLLQYQKAAGIHEDRDDEIRSLRSQCLERVNKLNLSTNGLQ